MSEKTVLSDEIRLQDKEGLKALIEELTASVKLVSFTLAYLDEADDKKLGVAIKMFRYLNDNGQTLLNLRDYLIAELKDFTIEYESYSEEE